MTNIAGRLAKLEKANPVASLPRVIRLVGRDEGESSEDAIARWCKEHPTNRGPPMMT
jgi:hypothetical protein